VGKANGKGKERKVEMVIAKPNLCATIGARAMDTAAMPRLATSPTMALKEVIKEKEKKDQRHYLLKP
jgi:hypothetical protein